MREEETLGQHETDAPLLGHEVAPTVGPHLARDADVPVVETQHAGQRQHGARLAAAVGTQDADDLTGLGGQCDVDLDRTAGQANSCVEPAGMAGGVAHRSHRPRRTPSTSTLTASSMMLIETATWGSRSSST